MLKDICELECKFCGFLKMLLNLANYFNRNQLLEFSNIFFINKVFILWSIYFAWLLCKYFTSLERWSLVSKSFKCVSMFEICGFVEGTFRAWRYHTCFAFFRVSFIWKNRIRLSSLSVPHRVRFQKRSTPGHVVEGFCILIAEYVRLCDKKKIK